MQCTTAAPAVVATWLDRPSLPSVDASAAPAAPGKAGQGLHFLFQRMVDRDRQCTVAVHLTHLPEKIRSMVRPPLEDVVLPLVDHLVCECTDEFVFPECRPCQQGLQQG